LDKFSQVYVSNNNLRDLQSQSRSRSQWRKKLQITQTTSDM